MKKLLLTGSMLIGAMLSAQAQTTFSSPFIITDEAADTLEITIVAELEGTGPATISIALTEGLGTASATDFTLLTPSLTFTESGSQVAKVKIENDALSERTEQFALHLADAVNTEIGDEGSVTVFIKDNDYTAPEARKNIELEHLGSYKVDMPGSSAEIVAYDSAGDRLYVVNSLLSYLHILDMSDPAAITEIDTINMLAYGAGITSVAVHDSLVAVAVHADPKTDNGKVVFFNTDGEYLNEVAAGALPDMVTFTPDGRYLLVANEGEPNGDYSVDPEGSVSIVDLQDGVFMATVTTADFADYSGMEDELRSEGIRIFGAGNPTAAQDFEPEYITVSANSDTAWITLQENNAIALLDLGTKKIEKLFPLGYVDHSLPENALDASDNNDSILIANWPVRGLYLPDGITSYDVAGQHYLVTANEGDAREYDPLEEEIRIKNGGYPLDAAVFPDAALLKQDHNIGRLNATSTMGDIDGDGDYDEIYVFGGRGFTIWNGTTGTRIFNSGDQFEQITAADPEYKAVFNASNEEENEVKNRSDNKGPEPEGITIGSINDTMYAFIALERTGGIITYDISNPEAPVFVQYINTRDLTEFGGDNGAEGILFLNKNRNPHREHLLITSNETSGTVAVFKVNATDMPDAIHTPEKQLPRLNIYPNPVQEGILYLSQQVSGYITDINGRIVLSFEKANKINTQSLAKGTYIFKAQDFRAEKVVIK